MSDKRPGQGFNYVQPKRKIPKLDISIVASGSTSSQQQPMARFVQPFGKPVTNGHQQTSVGHSSRNAPSVELQPEAMSEDMWGDDDVELIMLASQVAENVENVGQNILVGSMDISFGGFMRSGNANSCSTQKPPQEADDLLREFRTSDAAEDDVFTELIDYDQIDNIDKHIDEYLKNDQNSLAQGGGFATGSAARSSTVPKPTTSSLAEKPSTRVDAQIDKKQLELKTKLLCDQLSQIKRENNRLQSEVFKMNEKCQTKDGEIAMIRYDLQQNKNAQTELRKQKLEECERIKGEFSMKLNELDKRNQRQQTELEFKSLEIINLKSKQTHETTINRSYNIRPAAVEVKQKLPESTVANMFKLCLSDPPKPNSFAETRIFSQSRPLNHKSSLINGHTDHLRSNVTQLQLFVAELNAFHAAGQSVSDDLLERVFEIASKSMWIIRDECRIHDTCRKSLTKNMFYQYELDELNECREQLLGAESVHMDGEMFGGETLGEGRRVFCCLARVCEISRRFSEWMIMRQFRDECYTCLGLMGEAFTSIGYSDQWHYYFGVLESASMFLNAISKHYTPEDRIFDEPLQLALQSIIFCRPITKSLVHISSCLRTISTHFALSDFLNTLCRQCNDYVVIKESIKSVQFSPKSCPLQMFAVLLQTEFAQFKQLPPVQLDQLTKITLNSLYFLDYCAQKPVSWMFRQTDAPKKEPCLCYAQLVCACIVLLYLCLRHWVDNPKSIDLRIISTIAQSGVTMISDHFVMHYESIVLRVGGPSVKQRLHVAFSWICQHSKLFLFERPHLQAIQSISQLRRIPEMIELLAAGDGEAAEVGTDNAEAKQMWTDYFKSVAPTDTTTKSIDYEFNDSDPDNTHMVIN